eukprot:g73762.t1
MGQSPSDENDFDSSEGIANFMLKTRTWPALVAVSADGTFCFAALYEKIFPRLHLSSSACASTYVLSTLASPALTVDVRLLTVFEKFWASSCTPIVAGVLRPQCLVIDELVMSSPHDEHVGVTPNHEKGS